MLPADNHRGFWRLFGLITSPAAFAAEKTVTLAVQNMYCASCPYTVKHSLGAVPGVANVDVSFEAKTAVVTYDDTKTDVQSLTAATTKAGYPSFPSSYPSTPGG